MWTNLSICLKDPKVIKYHTDAVIHTGSVKYEEQSCQIAGAIQQHKTMADLEPEGSTETVRGSGESRVKIAQELWLYVQE